MCVCSVPVSVTIGYVIVYLNPTSFVGDGHQITQRVTAYLGAGRCNQRVANARGGWEEEEYSPAGTCGKRTIWSDHCSTLDNFSPAESILFWWQLLFPSCGHIVHKHLVQLRSSDISPQSLSPSQR